MLPTVEQIIDQLKTLTLIESSELVTQTKHSVCLHRKCAARNGTEPAAAVGSHRYGWEQSYQINA
jgi:ribosomal protein L7/L12